MQQETKGDSEYFRFEIFARKIEREKDTVDDNFTVKKIND